MRELNINDFEGLYAWKDQKKWVVLTPTDKSELGDILFEASPYDLALQICGGLEKCRVLKVLDNREEATTTAQLLIDIRDGVAQEAIKQMRAGLSEAHNYLSTRNLGEPADVLASKLKQILLVINSRG
jgi:hypothetical protein